MDTSGRFLRRTVWLVTGPMQAVVRRTCDWIRVKAQFESGAIVPGDAEASDVIARIVSDDPDYRMPPPGSRKELDDLQKQTLIRWVNEGTRGSLIGHSSRQVDLSCRLLTVRPSGLVIQSTISSSPS